MLRSLSILRLAAGLFAAALLATTWTGCGDSERFSYASETDEPNYREGISLLKSGRRQEALTAFLKVIDKRRDDAPESHLEVGLLYAQHINDPLSAIYHFRKYLALRPNSPQAPLVRQRIDAAVRDFARTLPAQPLDTQTQRVDLVATLDRLKQENEALKQQLADARAGRGAALAPSAAESPVEPLPNSGALNFAVGPEPTVQTVQTVRTRPQTPAPTATTARSATPPSLTTTRPATTVPPTRPTAPAVSTTTRPAGTATPTRPAPSTAAARRHTVRPGDTLSKLALQYYNDRAKWKEIYAANRDVMKSESDLRTGMQLKIP